MTSTIRLQAFMIACLFISEPVWAERPVVGRKAAEKYFSRAPAEAVEVSEDVEPGASRSRASSESQGNHYMALHLGGFVDSQAYSWGKNGDQKNAGKENLGVTYKLNEYTGSVDLMLRADLIWYRLDGGSANKLSVMPMLIFPEAASRFPLYFGVGVGPGVYLRQISGESALALDYQLVVGARLFNVFGNAGLTLETGLKNHFHLLGGGQFNGVFLTLGTVFIF